MKSRTLFIIALAPCLASSFGSYTMKPADTPSAPGSVVLADPDDDDSDDPEWGSSWAAKELRVMDMTPDELSKLKSKSPTKFKRLFREHPLESTATVASTPPATKKFIPFYLVAGDGKKIPFDLNILKNQSAFVKAALSFSEGFEKGIEKKSAIQLHPKLFPTEEGPKTIVKILYNLAGYAWQTSGKGKKLSGKLEVLQKARAVLRKLPKPEILQQADYLGAAELHKELVRAHTLADHWITKKMNPYQLAQRLRKKHIKQIRHGMPLGGHTDWVNSVAFSTDGTKVVSGSWDNTIKIWDATTGECIKTLTGHKTWVVSAALSPNGKQIVSGSIDETIKIWDVATGTCRQTLTGHTSSVHFSPDGAKVVSCSTDQTIRIWDVATGRCTQTLACDTGQALSAAFSPDGTKVVSGSAYGTIQIWDVKTGRCVKTLTGHRYAAQSVAFSPSSTQIVSGSADHTIKLWNVATGTCTQTLTGHANAVDSVAFSPNGTQIVSGSADHTIKLWNVATGRCTQTLAGDRSWVSSVAFSPDGTKVVSSSADKTVMIWYLLPLTLDQWAAYEFLNEAITETAKTPGIQELRLKCFVKDRYPFVREACQRLELVAPKETPAIWKLLRKVKPVLRDVREERKFGYAEAPGKIATIAPKPETPGIVAKIAAWSEG